MMVHLISLNHGFMIGLMDPVPARYAIRVNGHLGATTLSASRRWRRTCTARTPFSRDCSIDRLCGVLAQVEALGLDLVRARQLESERTSPESGDSRSR